MDDYEIGLSGHSEAGVYWLIWGNLDLCLDSYLQAFELVISRQDPG